MISLKAAILHPAIPCSCANELSVAARCCGGGISALTSFFPALYSVIGRFMSARLIVQRRMIRIRRPPGSLGGFYCIRRSNNHLHSACQPISVSTVPLLGRNLIRNQSIIVFEIAGGGARTHTILRSLDFESSASASSATPAKTNCQTTISGAKLKRLQRHREAADFAVVRKFREGRSRRAVLPASGEA